MATILTVILNAPSTFWATTWDGEFDGEIVQFQSGTIDDVDCITINSSKVLVVWNRNSATQFGKAVIATISGVTVTLGTELSFNGTDRFSSLRVDELVNDSKYLLMGQSGQNNKLAAFVLTVSGTTVTAGSINDSLSSGGGSGNFVGMSTVSATKAVVIYRNDTNGSNMNVVAISGDTVTVGADLTLDASAQVSDMRVEVIDSSNVLAVYIDGLADGYIQVLTIGATTLSTNTEEALGSTNMNNVRVVLLSTTKALVTYTTLSNSHISAQVIDISGTTLTVNTAVDDIVTGTTGQGEAALAVIDESTAIISYWDFTSGEGRSTVITVTGTVPAAGDTSPVAFNFTANGTRDTAPYLVDVHRVFLPYLRISDNSGNCLVLSKQDFS